MLEFRKPAAAMLLQAAIVSTMHKNRWSLAMHMKIMLLLACLTFYIQPAEAAELQTALNITASAWETREHGGAGDFPPENVHDGIISDLSSWRAEGAGVWLQFDLTTAQNVIGVALAFFKGDSRQYNFEITVSSSGKENDWTTVVPKRSSSGISADMESFHFPSTAARYIRVIGHGNTTEKFREWFNLTEAAVFVGK